MAMSPRSQGSQAPPGSRSPVLSAPLAAATATTITPASALKWSNNAPKQSELQPELLKNRAHLAIYLLPDAFAELKMPMASMFASIWLYGSAGNRKTETVVSDEPKGGKLSILRFALSDFSSSATFNRVVQATLDKAVSTLPQMALAEQTDDERWVALRRIAGEIASKYRKKDVWSEATSGFQSKLQHPDVVLEKRGITTDTFIFNGEFPTGSDCYGALGPFAVRSYLDAVISKKGGDDSIYVTPTRVGVRVWDSYDFSDENWDPTSLLSQILGRQASQFLGIWPDPETAKMIVLTNADFRSFRDQFMPVYNSTKPPPKPPMVCGDFKAVSDFAIKPIPNPVDYLLPNMKAA